LHETPSIHAASKHAGAGKPIFQRFSVSLALAPPDDDVIGKDERAGLRHCIMNLHIANSG
jgi:hypothetical protein